jgi:hypothetical protein
VQIAADSIEIVRREKVVGYEMSLMSQDELMELLGMTKVCRLTPPPHFSIVGAVCLRAPRCRANARAVGRFTHGV